MKKNFNTTITFVLLIFIFASCNDDITDKRTIVNSKKFIPTDPISIVDGRMVFASEDILSKKINEMKENNTFDALSDVKVISTEDPTEKARILRAAPGGIDVPPIGIWWSYYDFLYIQATKDLPTSAIQEIQNEGLVFCPEDETIADPYFCTVLNYQREIQINNTVFRYVDNGMYYCDYQYASELPTVAQQPSELRSSSGHTTFIPGYVETDVKLPQLRVNSSGEDLILKNNTKIPAADIRDVDFDSNGDANWVTRTWGNLWGKHVVAINTFGSRRIRMNCYDQDYKIYRNIGTKVNMQKHSWFIWWNTKAQEIRQGWSAVELKYSYSQNMESSISPPTNYTPTPVYPNPEPKTPVLPDYMLNKFPFQNESAVLVSLPWHLYDFTGKDANKLFRDGLKYGSLAAKNYFNTLMPKRKLGIFTLKEERLYIVFDQDETEPAYNKDDVETKFFVYWPIKSVEVGWRANPNDFNSNNFIPVNVDIGEDPAKTSLERAVIYAAVKYNDKWRACRITKTSTSN